MSKQHYYNKYTHKKQAIKISKPKITQTPPPTIQPKNAKPNNNILPPSQKPTQQQNRNQKTPANK